MHNQLQTRIDRYKELFRNPEPGQILGLFSRWTFPVANKELGLESFPNDHWDYENDPEAAVDHRVASLRAYLAHTSDLDHDWIPAIAVGGGTGLYGAYLTDAEVTFSPETSWAKESLDSYDQLDSIEVGTENRWTRAIERMVRRGVGLADGDYVASTMPHFAPSDMANAIRGNSLFTDVYDDPESVAGLLRLCAEQTVWMERRLRAISGLADGGSAGAGIWMPGTAPFMSEDAADLCSPDTYVELFRPATQRIVDQLGGAVIHHHIIGKAIHCDIAGLTGLSALQISEDPNRPSPITVAGELIDCHPPELPLILECDAHDVYESIETLKRGRVVLQIRISSKDEGREVMRFVRKHSRLG